MAHSDSPQNVAVIYCEGRYRSTHGKTAHGLVRFTRRYRVAAVIDSTLAGQDAGVVLDGQARGVPIVADLDQALEVAERDGQGATHLVIGVAPDGGQLDDSGRTAVLKAIDKGLNVDAGLHSFLSDDEELCAAALAAGVRLRDVRRPPARDELHFFSGKIEQVDSLVVAVLGTDSAVGKRTTAVLLAHGLAAHGLSAEVIGTGQTAWMQGVRHGILLDSLVNDFVAGELEHAVWSAWNELRPDVILIEGQGSLMHPAYPGGFEILAATRPHGVILQHAPARRDYDGFPGHEIPSVERHVAAIEIISPARTIGIAVNAAGLEPAEVVSETARLAEQTNLPTVDPVGGDIGALVGAILELRAESQTA